MKDKLTEIYDMFSRLGMDEVKRPLNEGVDPEYDGKVFYHTVLDRKDLGYLNLCKKIYNEGLRCNDNGELGGDAIWFAPDSEEYNQLRDHLQFALEYNAENKEKYDLYTDGGTMFAHKDIPFGDLTLICCPIMKLEIDGELRSWFSNLLRIKSNNPNDLINDFQRWTKSEDKVYTIFADALALTTDDNYASYIINKVQELNLYNFQIGNLFS